MSQLPPRRVEELRRKYGDAYAERYIREHAEGVQEERARARGILLSKEAAGRWAQATTIYEDTDLDVEEARRLLASSPRDGEGASGMTLTGAAAAQAWARALGRPQ